MIHLTAINSKRKSVWVSDPALTLAVICTVIGGGAVLGIMFVAMVVW